MTLLNYDVDHRDQQALLRSEKRNERREIAYVFVLMSDGKDTINSDATFDATLLKYYNMITGWFSGLVMKKPNHDHGLYDRLRYANYLQSGWDWQRVQYHDGNEGQASDSDDQLLRTNGDYN